MHKHRNSRLFKQVSCQGNEVIDLDRVRNMKVEEEKIFPFYLFYCLKEPAVSKHLRIKLK